MNTPVFGSWSVEVTDVRPFTIHGDQYLELHVVRTDDKAGSDIALKVAQHSIEGAVPSAGDRVVVSFLAGQVTSVKPVA
jgi:hypothetical protein